MYVEPKLEYSSHLCSIVGVPTLPGKHNENIAKYLLVIQVCGLLTPYKYVIAWEMTADTVNPDSVIILLESCINALIGIGMNVRSITSDMGPRNMEIWNNYGIWANRLYKPHPSTIDSVLIKEHLDSCCSALIGKKSIPVHFIADPSHLFKNIRNMLLSHDFRLPSWAVAAWHIDQGGDVVSWKYIRELFQVQQDARYRMA